jgi:glycerol-3-phosphate acyltransferase PlsY
MELFVNILIVISAYLIGSIPSAVWIGKFFYKVDVRQHGSKNAGASNTIRILGLKAGLPVLLLDVFKGFGAVKLIYLTNFHIPASGEFVNFQLMLAVAAVLGHIFPIYVGFKGGKGVATLLGTVLAIHPYSALISIGIFAISLIITKYVSLSSMIAGFSFPVLIIIIFKTTTLSLCIFSLTIAILLMFTHQKNIERLIRREENKAKLFKRLRKEENIL